MTPEKSDELDRVKERIDEICRSSFAEKPAILLSELGTALGSDLALLKRNGHRLTEFIGQRFSGIYRVTRIPNRGQAIIVVPASLSEEEVSQIDFDAVKPKSSKIESVPRFRTIFWTAFAKPITEGHRYLSVEPLQFRDTSGPRPSGDQWIEVSSDLIPPEDLPNRDAAVWESIRKWLQTNNLREEQFTVQSAYDEPRRMTLLHAVIYTLDAEQQRQIALPLDVIRKLLGRTVSW